MKKRALLLALFGLCMAMICQSALAAYPADSYYNLGFTEDYDVYTGPGEHYYRADGTARYGGGGVRYYGSDPATGWLLIGYKTSSGLWRMGYVHSNAAYYTRPSDNYNLFDLQLEYTPYRVTVSSKLTDDPMMDEHQALCYLSAGTDINFLCRWNNGWAYVEVLNSSVGLVRGFIRPANIQAGASGNPPQPVITQTPRPYVTATPRPYITSRPPQYESSWETLYYNYLASMNYAEMYDMELIDLDFNGTPEVLMRGRVSGRGNQYSLLSVYQGYVRRSDYFAYDGQNNDWALSNGTYSNLYMVRNAYGGQRQWLKIGGSSTGSSYYGAVCTVGLQAGYIQEQVMFTYDVPMYGHSGQQFFTVRGYSSTRTDYYSELRNYQSTYPRNPYYAPCYTQSSYYNRLTTFSSLASTYKNVTQYQVFQ